jgi:trehalose synthase
MLDQYAQIVGADVTEHLRQLSRSLAGSRIIHVNSTKEGGGVAEILHKLLPLKHSLGLQADWHVINGDQDYYNCTKTFHNGLQGAHVAVNDRQLAHYEEINEQFAKDHAEELADADIVYIHDPQPAAVLNFIPRRRGKWIWRCHIDISRPNRPLWRYLSRFVRNYDASIFSLPEFTRHLPHTQFIIPPSIDPLSDKNKELSAEEIAAVHGKFNLDPERPIILQVSRFDRFKDPVGVIEAYRMARRFAPLQLVLAGGTATDDPEGATVLKEVRQAAGDDPDIHVLLLPPDSHRTINALQRAAHIVVQKSIREGFGLTVTEAMWKSKPVIGGDVGGIRLQVVDNYTGFLVRTPEGAALRIRYLLHRRERLQEMGERGKRHALENFLLTRHLRDYLALMLAVKNGISDRLEVGAEGGKRKYASLS